MRRPGRRDEQVPGGTSDVVDGPLDDPRTALAARLITDRSLLDDVEIVYEPEGADGPFGAAVVDDELAAERAAEAELLLRPRAVGEEDPLTPETLEQVLEPSPTATDETLHEIDPLLEALLDEGTALDPADADDFEAEIAGGAWRDSVD